MGSALQPVTDQDWEAIADASASRYERLLSGLQSRGHVLIAYSGGCDSAFLLKAATQVLGTRATGLTAIGESLAPGDREAAHALAVEMGAQHIEAESHEIENPSYAANPTNRCYFCKTELYDI